jgi:type I restriction enzyme S subunit
MKQGKMSRSRLSGLKDEQDLGTQKIRKSLNQANPDADNKQDWEIEEFEKCLEKVTYTNKIQRKDFKEEGVYPIISQERDFINGYWDNEEDLFRVDKPVVIFGDHTQVIKFIDFDFVLGADGVKILKPKDKIDSKYFYYFLQNIDLGSLGYARHYRILKEINVSYPKSLSEQQRIVSILDECFAAIAKAKANAEQNLKNAKELFESYLQGVFENGNWEKKTLNQISENLDSKRIPITKNQRKSGSIPYYGASGIVDYVADYIFDEDLLCISEDGANLLARTYPIAFSISGKTWVNNHAHVLKFPNIITQKFVEVYINSIRIDDYVSGMAQPKLNQAMLNKIPIPYPSIDEQQTIVRQLDALRAETQKLEAVYQKKTADLEELKKSILQKAFAGELRGGEPAEPKTDKIPKG